jgi:hypothetical protein
MRNFETLSRQLSCQKRRTSAAFFTEPRQRGGPLQCDFGPRSLVRWRKFAGTTLPRAPLASERARPLSVSE